MMDLARFAVTLAVLYAAHAVADHWVQTHHQAVSKAGAGARGWLACIAHVATYTAVLTIAIGAVSLRYPAVDYGPVAVSAGLALNGLTHLWADRRHTLRALAVLMGKRAYWDDVPGGAYQLDQAWHYGWLLASAFVIAA